MNSTGIATLRALQCQSILTHAGGGLMLHDTICSGVVVSYKY
jgi:hypothetical protein